MPQHIVSIRSATIDDLSAINDIYNYYVRESTATYQTEPETIEARHEWFAHHGPPHPVTVVEFNEEIVGWGSLSAFHSRAGYARTVENSVYVDHRHHRRGIGRVILQDLIDRARLLGHHAIVAGIDAEQSPSVTLHLAMGFEQVGHLKEVGHKFGRWLDVLSLQLIL